MNCRVCGSEEMNPVLDLGEMPLANRLRDPKLKGQIIHRYPLALEACRACTFVQTTYVVPPEAMYNDYPYSTGTSRAAREHFAALAAYTVGRAGLKPGDLVVDIGSNDGTLLQHFQAMRMRVGGIDPSIAQAAIAEKNGIPTRVGYFDAVTADHILQAMGPAKLVTATNVLSHVHLIHEFLRSVRFLLHGSGTFVTEFYYLPSLLANGAFDQVYHEHLSYFTVRTYRKLLKKAGLELYDVDVVPAHGGSLRAFAGLPGAHAGNGSVGRLLEEESPAGDLFDRFEDFGEKVERVKSEFIGFLEAEKEAGRRVWGYTAPAKATVLLNACGVDSRLIPFIVDNNPLKQGKMVPGADIRIIGPDQADLGHADTYVIFSWNLAKEILEDLAWMKKKGVRFFVPLPELVEVGI